MYADARVPTERFHVVRGCLDPDRIPQAASRTSKGFTFQTCPVAVHQGRGGRDGDHPDFEALVIGVGLGSCWVNGAIGDENAARIELATHDADAQRTCIHYSQAAGTAAPGSCVCAHSWAAPEPSGGLVSVQPFSSKPGRLHGGRGNCFWPLSGVPSALACI